MNETPDIRIAGRRTPLDYLFFLRPVLLPPVWTIAILGANAVPFDVLSSTSWRTTAFLLQLGLLFGAVYTLNQICDIESDRQNRKLHFLPEGIITIPAAWRFTIALNATALLLAALIARTRPSGGFGYDYLLLTLAIMALGAVYSAGPSPWKNRPILGLSANILAHGAIVYLLGVAFTGERLTDHLQTALGYVSAVGGVYLMTTIADVPGDQHAGKRTVSVLWGARVAAALAFVLVLATVALAWVVKDWLLFGCAVLVTPLYLSATLKPVARFASRAAKASVALLSLAAVFVYPSYLLLLAVGFIGTRLFFHWRFGMTYPTLT